LFVADYNYYSQFYKNIVEFDFGTSGIVPLRYANTFIDYPLYTPIINNLVKLSYSALLIQIYFQAYTYKNYQHKYNYLNKFYMYIKQTRI
jgi:hypothetical protein